MHRPFPYLVLLCFLASSASGGNDPGLMISPGAESAEHALGQIRAGLQAISSDGHLMIASGNDSPNVTDALRMLAPNEKSRVLEVKLAKVSSWIRDSAMGWTKNSDGRYSLVGGGELSYDDGVQFNALLSICSQGRLALPKTEEHGIIQGGNFVEDGAGLCAIPSDVLDSSVRDQVDQKFKCKTIIEMPSYDQWVGHENGHADIGIAFLAPGIALVPEIPSSCKGKLNSRYRKLFDDIARKARTKGARVEREGLAAQCLGDGGPSRYNPTVVVRSYSNLTILKDSILIPRYEPAPSDTAETQQTLRNSNKKMVDHLERLMAAGIVPRKKIVTMPISSTDILAGGAARCKTLTIPERVDGCTQAQIEEAIAAFSTEAERLVDCLKSANPEICRLAKNLRAELATFAQPLMKETKLISPGGREVDFSKIDLLKIQGSIIKLSAGVSKTCNNR